jgi:hypothetical protein
MTEAITKRVLKDYYVVAGQQMIQEKKLIILHINNRKLYALTFYFNRF